MTMLTHNIVLSFEETKSSAYVEFVQKHFADIASNYRLSETIIPHVTLSHTYITDEEQEKQIVEKLDSINIPKICLQPLGLSYSFRNNGEYIIVEIVIKKDRELLELHKNVCEILQSLELPVLTPSGIDYYPHITFCKMDGTQFPQVDMPRHFMDKISKNIFLSFGTSDNSGQFTGINWQKGID